MVLRSLIASSLHMTPEHGTIEISLSVVSGSAGPPDDHQDGRPFIRLPNPTEDFLSDRSLMVRVTIKDTGAGIPKVLIPLSNSLMGSSRHHSRLYSTTPPNSAQLIINRDLEQLWICGVCILLSIFCDICCSCQRICSNA